MTLVPRLRGRPRIRTDLQSTTSSTTSTTPRRSRPISKPYLSQQHDQPKQTDPHIFSEKTDVEWVLRGGTQARNIAAAARAASKLHEIHPTPPSSPPPPHRRSVRRPRHISDHVDPSASRRVQFTRSSRPPPLDPDSISRSEPRSDSARAGRTVSNHAFYDPDVDHHWRLPIGKPLRRADLLRVETERRAADMPPAPGATTDDQRPTRWSNETVSETDVRILRANAFQTDRSDRRGLPSAWRTEDGNGGRPRDRTANRIGGGARWRGLLARKDLVDGKADAYAYTVDSGGEHELSPRSSLDIEEANSLYSWDEPPSTSVRGWRSNHSLSYRPRPNERPRHIRVIGRQKCINDLTDIVDASNEPCVSYDRQIFDPASKLWTYVEASQPSSSPWELRTVGSPVTCSVSGTEEAVSSASGRHAAPASAQSTLASSQPASGTVSIRPPTPSAPLQVARRESSPTRRRNSSPTRSFAPVDSQQQAELMFMATRDQWLGYSKKSVYGPANLEAVIFASEMDDEEEARRRQSEEVLASMA